MEFNKGDAVLVDDGQEAFEGILLNDENAPYAIVQDLDDGDILRGDWQFVEKL